MEVVSNNECGYILKDTGFLKRSDVEWERNRGVKDDYMVLT